MIQLVVTYKSSKDVFRNIHVRKWAVAEALQYNDLVRIVARSGVRNKCNGGTSGWKSTRHNSRASIRGWNAWDACCWQKCNGSRWVRVLVVLCGCSQPSGIPHLSLSRLCKTRVRYSHTSVPDIGAQPTRSYFSEPFRVLVSIQISITRNDGRNACVLDSLPALDIQM